jgi:hypothetical protein
LREGTQSNGLASPAEELVRAPEIDRMDQVMVIQRRTGWKVLDLRDVWRDRELLYFLTWRDIKVRFKQTVFGAAWAVLQLLMMMAVFSVVCGGSHARHCSSQ